MSKIIELVKEGAKAHSKIVDEMIRNSLQNAELHHEEIDSIMSIDFNSIDDSLKKEMAIYMAMEALQDAKETLADMKKLLSVSEKLNRIIHGRS